MRFSKVFIHVLTAPPCIMSVHYNEGVCSTPGDVQYTGGYHEYTGVYHDVWEYEYSGDVQYNGGYHEYTGMFSTLGVVMSTLGDTKMHVGVIMSTPGDVQYTGGIPGVHQGCSVHQRDTMSTTRGYHEHTGGFWYK